MDHEARLMGFIDQFLAGTLGFPAFQLAYSAHYIDELPDGALSAAREEAFGEVHEAADWITADPSPEERGYGWRNPAEFRLWLTVRRRTL
ncbi:MAG: hypothetical protein JWM27_723 [Gemmatimonadetes bacterium]|nr:hypothetical protein [Gemmatimonadota bacterium]